MKRSTHVHAAFQPWTLAAAGLLAVILAAVAFAPRVRPMEANSQPARPTGLAATAGDQSVTLSWNDPSDSNITSYQYQTYLGGTSQSWGKWTEIPNSDSATTFHTFNGLTNGKEYRYRVRAVNAHGESKPAPHTSPYYVSAIPTGPPALPTGLAATAGDQSVTLSWSDPDNSTITRYEYQVNHNATDSENFAGWTQWTEIPGSDSSTTSHGFTGLTNGREYRYKVRAVNDTGVSKAAPDAAPGYVSATLDGPPLRPTGLAATAGDQSVTLTWNDPGNPSISGYEYQVNHDNTGTGNLSGWSAWADIPDSGSSTTSHAFTGLTSGKEYRYKIRAVNARGESEPAPYAEPWYVGATPTGS